MEKMKENNYLEVGVISLPSEVGRMLYYSPEDPGHQKGDSRKNVAHGCSKCRCGVFHAQKVEVLVYNWSVNCSHRKVISKYSRIDTENWI